MAGLSLMGLLLLPLFLLNNGRLPTEAARCGVGFYGSNCSLSCSRCKDRCNSTTGVCLSGCKAGYFGDRCTEPCKDFKYGPNCIHSCGHCFDDKTCDPISGNCTDGCILGWTQETCNKACESYLYGKGCKNRCGFCHNDQPCHVATGFCSGGCMPGWFGQKCDKRCQPGKYGLKCLLQCSNCAGKGNCDHVTGKCIKGCKSGWSRFHCDQHCPIGQYGPSCESTCGVCGNTTCHHITGKCSHGCSSGWKGSRCKDRCPAGKYGKECSSDCGHCKEANKCNSTNGICTTGCVAGWRGVHCDTVCQPGYYGDNCKFNCGECLDGSSCNRFNGSCSQGCKLGWMGFVCKQMMVYKNDEMKTIVPVLAVSVVVLVTALSATVIYFICLRPKCLTVISRFYRLYQSPTQVNTEEHVYERMQRGRYELNRSNLILTSELLGHGHFGQVTKGYVKRDSGLKISVAVKSLKENSSEKDKQDFMNELTILKKVGLHPNVVCLVGACHIRGILHVALEYAKYGDLRTYLRKSRKIKGAHYCNSTTVTNLKQSTLLKFALDVANGLYHLAERQIIHRDVAARNILLDENLIAKVADFGLSKNDDTYVKMSNTRVPVRWMALESLFNNTYTIQSDVWSFGVLLWEIVTIGGTPFAGIDTQDLVSLLREGYRMRKPTQCDSVLYDIMIKCWHEQPECRPTFPVLCRLLQRMLEDSQVYMNLERQEDFQYEVIDADKEDDC